jgi:hypothetical protein
VESNERTLELRPPRGGAATWSTGEPDETLARAAFFGVAASAVAPVARGVVSSGQLAPHHARRRARLLAAAGALLLVPSVRAGATVIDGSGTIAAPVSTVTGAGNAVVAPPVARGVLTVSYAGQFAAQRQARLDAARPQVLQPRRRLATVTGTGAIASPIASVTGSGGPVATRRGVRIAADYSAVYAARDERRANWPLSQVVLGVPRLPPVVGSGAIAAPIATVTGVGGPPATAAPVARGILSPDYTAHRLDARARLDALRSQIVTPKRRPATIVVGTGALSAPIATVGGAGSPIVTGSGALSAALATLLGLGSPVVTGAGVIATPIASLTGASADLLLGSGTIGAPVATVTGAGVGVVTGSGVLSAPIAQLRGTETRPPRLAIDVRLAPTLALDPALAATLSLAVSLAPVLRVDPSLDPGP